MGRDEFEKGIQRRGFLRGLGAGMGTAFLAALPREVNAATAVSDWVYNPAGVRLDGLFVDELLRRTMADQGIDKPALAAQFPRVKVERIVSADPFTHINRLFYLRGWTDGLPIVPPTEDRVHRMLQGTDLPPEDVIGVLDPMRGQATVSKIAVNAVMAGCRPEYLPVVIAAVESLADQDFNLLGVATTTNPDTPMVFVNGPVAKQLDINSSTNALGRGWQANAAIGRAVSLIVNNIGGSWPGVNDMSCLGQPGEFAMCLAENEEANPWNPLHQELGYAPDSNVVTVFPVEGLHSILGIGWDMEGYLRLVSDHLASLDRAHRSTVLMFIAQDTAIMLAKEGWTKASIREFIYENARMPFSKYKERFIDTNKARAVPDWVLETTDPDAMIPVPFMDNFLIVVSGGAGEKSMLMPVWSATAKVISNEVRLPKRWDKLLERAEQDRDAYLYANGERPTDGSAQ